MEPNSFSKKFIFNEKIDSDYLYGLYADDYVYIEEVFGTTLQHFDADFERLKAAWEEGNLHDLKKAAHKLKPTFGFAGLTAVQEQLKQFEDLCQNSTSTAQLKSDYTRIVTTLAESKDLIASEYQKLKVFNANPL